MDTLGHAVVYGPCGVGAGEAGARVRVRLGAAVEHGRQRVELALLARRKDLLVAGLTFSNRTGSPFSTPSQ